MWRREEWEELVELMGGEGEAQEEDKNLISKERHQILSTVINYVTYQRYYQRKVNESRFEERNTEEKKKEIHELLKQIWTINFTMTELIIAFKKQEKYHIAIFSMSFRCPR